MDALIKYWAFMMGLTIFIFAVVEVWTIIQVARRAVQDREYSASAFMRDILPLLVSIFSVLAMICFLPLIEKVVS